MIGEFSDNLEQNIERNFCVSSEFSFTASEVELDNLGVRLQVASRVTNVFNKRLKTQILGN